MTLRPYAVLIAAACGLGIAPLGANAAGHAGSPPTVVLHAGGHTQRGGLVWQEWTSGDGHLCVTSSADGTGTFPTPARVSPGHHGPRFVLFRKQRPSDIQVTAWHKLNRRGYETGPSEELPYALHPRLDPAGGVTAWRVRFDVDVPPPYYLHLYAAWPGGRCGGPRQLLRTFAIKAR
jgi:hypothetical protein